jgi:hypothetical protein
MRIFSKLVWFLLALPALGQVTLSGGASVAGGALVCVPPSTTTICTLSPSSYSGPGPVTVTVTCPGSESGTYTTDGSTPNIASTLYSSPITISAAGTTTIKVIGSNLVAHNANTQTSIGNISGTGIGYKCNTQNTQTYGSLTCTAAGGVTGQPTNVALTFGSTMNYTQTSTGSAQSLIPYFGTATGGSVDSCTYFAQDKYIEAVGTAIANNEVDGQLYNHSYGISHTMGWQANQSGTNSGKWQIDANGGTGWVTTDCTTAIPISTSAYTHIAITGHWINGDTGCTGNGCFYYDHQTVNGTDCDLSYLGGQPQGTTSDRSLMANQDQLDSTSAGGTIGRNIQNNTVACSSGPPSAVTVGTYTITSQVATPVLIPNNYTTGNNALAESSPVLAFGKQGASTSSPAIPISISNPSNSVNCSVIGIGCGAGSVTVTSMAISGPNASDFTLSGSCTTITSGSDCEPTIAFKPTAAANTNETATLTVNYSGATTANQTMSLTGTSATVTTLSTSSCPTALSGSTNYQLTANITCAGTVFTGASSGTDLNLNGYTITYGNTSSSSQVNGFASAGYNTQITIHNGTIASGAGTNTFGYSHPQSSPIGETGGYAYSNTSASSFFNLKITYGIQYANGIEDNGGYIIVHDDLFEPSAVGTCATTGCRNQYYAATIYQYNTSTTTGAQIYNNASLGGPQGAFQVPSNGATVEYNFLNPGNASGGNTNDFCIYSQGENQTIEYNVCATPLTASTNTRGILVSGAVGSTAGTIVEHNVVGGYELPVNSEYGGCEEGGTYGIQADDNPTGPVTISNNYVLVTAKACAASALRLTDVESASVISQDNSYVAVRASGATTCVTGSDVNEVPPGCAYGTSIDDPLAFTSIGDTFTGDSGNVDFDTVGSQGANFETPQFFKPSTYDTTYHTYTAMNGSTTGGGGPVENTYFIDPTYNTGTGATNINIPSQTTGYQGPVSFYSANWTQTMTVVKASGPAASGSVVTWTDTLSNTYTCTTNSGGVCSVAVPQYRINNDSAANGVENRNPYSLSITLSGCTTYTASGITVSATEIWPTITLGGC